MSAHEVRRPPAPPVPDAGPFRREAWRSPLRGPWLASILSSALLPLIVTCAVTGLLSHAAYEPALGHNELFPAPDLFPWRWPRDPAWLYGLTQGLHIICGLTAIPILLAKLWTVIPKLFEVPPVRSIAHGLERLGLALLVGGSLFVFATGVLNIQLWYPFGFSFVPAHYWAALAFLGALAFHIATKVGVARKALRVNGVIAPLRDDLEHTLPEHELDGIEDTSLPVAPRPPTISRRALLGTVAVGSIGMGMMGFGQVAGGPFRRLAFLAPRGDGFGSGPNDFQVNKTFQTANIAAEHVGAKWGLVLEVDGERRAAASRADLLALEQITADLPIACVEGWTTTQTWTGVRLSDLARLAGAGDPAEVEVRSLQPRGAFRRATLSREQIDDPRALLALKVNGAPLSLDHGYPARIIVPALPGVHNTKWVGKLVFKERA